MARAKDLAERFEQFHKTNPQVFETLKNICLELLAAGVEKVGIDYVHARMRWLAEVDDVVSEDDYKFDTNFRPFYARLLMKEVPELDDFFNLRPSQADAVMLSAEAA